MACSAFSIKKVTLKNSRRAYVTLRLIPFDVNDDEILLFTFYKHCRKQISAVILKPNIEISSSTCYLYEKFFCRSTAQTVRIFTHEFTILRT